ncbi:hypothetical protein ACS0TY_002779 [Phlomoides rotata]
MAAHSNRSPSPLCSRPTNPNLRNSENNSANRRSFSGNKPFSKPSVHTNSRRFDPMTPANSPSDVASRRCVVEEKENCEKEDMFKSSKLQSPAKGCKHFMSPTISAASKFTPSPRKKVLVERNDPVRTSISLSDGKASFFSSVTSNVWEHFDPKSEMGHQNQGVLDSKVADSAINKATAHVVHPVSKPSKRVSFSDVPAEIHLESESLSESVITDSNKDSIVADSDSLKLDSSLTEEADSPCIDADPLLPPYDPKSNYLSPRPQFLLYKPNPRIEVLLNKEKGLDPEGLQDNLMEEIMSENFSDSSEGSEVSSQNEEIEVTASADDMVIGMDEMEADNHVPEPPESLPISTPVNNVVSEEDLVQKNGKKPRALFRVMCFSTLLMLFFVACVSISSITYSPHEFAQKDLILSDLSNLYRQSRAAAKVNFDRFSARVDQLKASSVSYFSELANELGKGGKQAPVQFVNLSDLQVENTWSEGIFFSKATDGLKENLEEEELDAEMDIFEEEYAEETGSDEKQDDVVLVTETDTFGEEEAAYAQLSPQETFEKGEEQTLSDSVKSADESESEFSQIQRESIDTKQLDEQNIVDQPKSGLEAPLDVATDPASSATDTIFLDHKSESDVNTPSEEGVQSSSEDNSFAHRAAIGVSSLFAAVLAAAAFTYHYKRNQQPCSAPLLSKENWQAGTKQHYNTYQEEEEHSQSWQTEVDAIGSESCPSSEMSSSFQKGASYSSSKKGGANEAVSSERKARKINKRESLASSSELSTGSPSYGSFTTYEKIQIKHGNGEDEIVTPVRRSSRIRNHHS